MDEELYEKLACRIHKKCAQCGESISVELYLSRKADGLYAWQEGLCSHCGNRVSTPLPEAILVMDETAKRVLAN